MANSNGQPAGWYPRQDLPGQEDYWDGAAWASTPRPAQPVAAPPGPPPASAPAEAAGKKKRGCGFWLMLCIAAVVLIVILSVVARGSGSDSEDTGATVASNASTEAEESVSEDSPSEAAEESADQGTQENPYKFGETHSREPGFSGAGWTVSIDDVFEVPSSSIFADDEDPRICLAVVVTVTLDSLDSDELVSNPFSMPDINVIDLDGQKAEDGFLECDVSGLVADGIDSKFDVAVTVGGTATYVDPVLIASTEYSFVAVESTIYER